MRFSPKEVETMGAAFYLQGQMGTVHCVACGKGEVEFSPLRKPVLGMVQVHTLRCDNYGRTGRHPN